jgi:hypothetical protein
MFEPFIPQRFCREYVEVKNDDRQLINFMATALGFKPLMDDWIAVDLLDRYREACAVYGLEVEADSVFLMAVKDRLPSAVVGRDNLATTVAYGVPAEASPPPQGWAPLGARVHVFVSRDRALLRHGMWYPLIIRNRVFWPPRADLLSFGRLLGYPKCCIGFFRRYNNWLRYSFLWEIQKRSAIVHPLCNPLTKDLTYSYIYHMPCSFACPATIELAGKLREAIGEREPELVTRIDRHLRLPALVFRERKIYFFEGVASVNRIDYTSWVFEGGELGANVLDEALAAGNAVEVEGQKVRVLSGREELFRVTCKTEGFAPEHPFVISFR